MGSSLRFYLQNSKYCTIQQEVGKSRCVHFPVHIYTQTQKWRVWGKIGGMSLGMGNNW